MNEDRNARSIGASARDMRKPVLAGLLVVCLVLAVSGCLPFSLPFSLSANSEGTRTLPPTPTATKTPFSTWPATWTPTATPTVTSTSTRYPTLTPLPGTPGPGGGAWNPEGGAVTGGKGDLGIQYWITDVYCLTGSSYAANFVIRATGGGGNYTYYRDIDKIAGPVQGEVTYRLVWMDCGGAPGTFFVESRDGQRTKVLFWVDTPDCCVKYTPTP